MSSARRRIRNAKPAAASSALSPVRALAPPMLRSATSGAFSARCAAPSAAPRPTTLRRAGESIAESDDEVRRNIPAELEPVFDRVRRQIKGSARRSRTEAFLEWAEANPDEVLAMQADAAADDAERMWREQMERVA